MEMVKGDNDQHTHKSQNIELYIMVQDTALSG